MALGALSASPNVPMERKNAYLSQLPTKRSYGTLFLCLPSRRDGWWVKNKYIKARSLGTLGKRLGFYFITALVRIFNPGLTLQGICNPRIQPPQSMIINPG